MEEMKVNSTGWIVVIIVVLMMFMVGFFIMERKQDRPPGFRFRFSEESLRTGGLSYNHQKTELPSSARTARRPYAAAAEMSKSKFLEMHDKS